MKKQNQLRTGGKFMINQLIAEKYGDSLIKINEELKSLSSDLELHKKFTTILKNHGFISGYEFQGMITLYFGAIFEKLSCNSKVIYPKNDNNAGITMGKYGIGIKWGAQADVVKSYGDIMKLIKNYKSQVLTGLNNHRKWKKAEEFEKFIEIISISENSTEFRIPLKKRIKIMYKKNLYSYDSISKIPITHLKFDTRKAENVTISGIIYNICPEKEIRLDKLEDNRFATNIINHFLFEDQIEDLCKMFEKIIIRETKLQKRMLKDLDNNFGKYLMGRKL